MQVAGDGGAGAQSRPKRLIIWMLLLLTREPDVLHCCRGAAPAVKAVVEGQSARRRARKANMVRELLRKEKMLRKDQSKRPPPSDEPTCTVTKHVPPSRGVMRKDSRAMGEHLPGPRESVLHRPWSSTSSRHAPTVPAPPAREARRREIEGAAWAGGHSRSRNHGGSLVPRPRQQHPLSAAPPLAPSLRTASPPRRAGTAGPLQRTRLGRE